MEFRIITLLGFQRLGGRLPREVFAVAASTSAVDVAIAGTAIVNRYDAMS
jgi:hypothetical protein